MKFTLAILLVDILLVGMICAHPDPTPAEPWIVANVMARQYEVWARLRNARVTDEAKAGTLATQEFQEWQRVKAAWRALERSVDLEYRGGK